MANPTEHALEHGEHSAHAAHDPFDRRVTMTIAIVAALLACVTMLSHRAHNQTLQLQLKATDAFSNEANQWNRYQSKRNRQILDERSAAIVGLMADAGADAKLAAARKSQISDWTGEAGRYKEDIKEIEADARAFQQEAKDLREDSAHMHHLGDRYDMAELGIELGLVLCSIAVLTKRKDFWLVGILVAAAGLALMSWGAYEQFIAHPISSH